MSPVDELPGAPAAPRIGVVELPALAQFLTRVGFNVVQGEDFRSTVAAIRSGLETGTFPVIVADVARPGLKAWIDRTATATATVVLSEDPNAEFSAPMIALPATLDTILGTVGIDAGRLAGYRVNIDGTVKGVITGTVGRTDVQPAVSTEPTGTEAVVAATIDTASVAPIIAPEPAVDLDPWEAQTASPVAVAAEADSLFTSSPVSTPAASPVAVLDQEEDPWEVQKAAVLVAARKEIEAEVTRFQMEEQIVPIVPLETPEAESFARAELFEAAPLPLKEATAVEVAPFAQEEEPAAPVPTAGVFTETALPETVFSEEVAPAPADLFADEIPALTPVLEPLLPPLATAIPLEDALEPVAPPLPAVLPPVEMLPYVAPLTAPTFAEPTMPTDVPDVEQNAGQDGLFVPAPVSTHTEAPVNPIDFAINTPQEQYRPPAAPADLPPVMESRPRMTQDVTSMIPSVGPKQDFSTDLAPLIFVISGRGGVGKSMLSMSLAQRAAEIGGLRTILIDGNRGQGDIRVYLRLTRSQLPSVYDAALRNDPQAAIISPERLSAERGPALEHLKFALALAPPDGMADPSVIRPDLYAGVIAAARQVADLVVCDTQIIESVDQVGIVEDLVTPALRAGAWGLGISDLSAAGVHNLLDRLKTMNSAGVARDRLLVTLNKVPHSGKYDQTRTSEAFNLNGNFLGAIEADDNVIEIMNSGNTAASHSAVAPILDECLFRITGNDAFTGLSYTGRTVAKANRPDVKKKRWGRRG